MYNDSKKTECLETKKCCFRDSHGRCMVLTEALPDCRFAKLSRDRKPYRLGNRPKKKAPVDGWPYY